ncbi:hypothetical protein FC682_26990 [Peribacillus simplex]|uniref:histidine kinase n=1 Tax=Peribacillus simplex TaxID=1478 RepID=A0A9X8ZD50_9BACI|nr:hypothetical protein [Peribacillus simplex]TKG97764.1 hypothetical protein FC682_26990 [Peribacillus simplex]TKH06909.1 hypothetical protein FC678_23180 [Peribacillus simplex]
MKLKSFIEDRLYFIFYTVLLVSLLIIAYALAVLEAGNHISVSNIIYLIILALFMMLLFLAGDYIRHYRFLSQLARMKQEPSLSFEYVEAFRDPLSNEQKLWMDLFQQMNQVTIGQLQEQIKLKEQYELLIHQWVHQIKTPVSVISLLVQEGNRTFSDETMKDYLKEIEEENDRFRRGLVAPIKSATTLMVVDDQLYHEFTADVPLKEKVRVRGYEVKDWEESKETSAKIEKMSNNPDHNQLQTRAPIYQEMKQGSILILFIGLFVSLLFFIVQGSMMYLRVFTNLEDKKIQIHALHRLGLTKKEIQQILSAEIRILFFAPFLIGMIHALVAYVALSNLLGSNLYAYSAMVIATYFLFQLLYYQVTKKMYERAVINSIK